MGRYNKDGTGIPHKGKMPPRIPKSELKKFSSAASKLRGVGNLLGLVPGLLDEIDRALRARENGRTYKKQLDKDLKDAEYLDTPWGIIPNPCHEGPRLL